MSDLSDNGQYAPSLSQYIHDKILEHKQITKPIFGLGAGLFVAPACFGVNTLGTYAQVGMPQDYVRGAPFLWNLQNLIKPLASGFMMSYPAGLFKTGILSQETHVREQINQALDEDKNTIKTIFISSTMVGLCDTFVGAWLTNNSFAKVMKLNTQLYSNANPNLWEKVIKQMKFASIGIGAKALRNTFNAYMLTLTTMVQCKLLQDYDNELTNIDKAIVTGSCSVLGGTFSALLTNPFDIIAKQQMKRTSFPAIKAPSFYQTAKDIFTNAGWSGFGRGKWYGALTAATAFTCTTAYNYMVMEPVFGEKAEADYQHRQHLMGKHAPVVETKQPTAVEELDKQPKP